MLSGGLDSAVAGFQLRDQGVDFSALTIVNRERGANTAEVECSELIARELGVRQIKVDLSATFELFKDLPGMMLSVGGAMACLPPGPGPQAAPLSVDLMHIVALMYAISHGYDQVIWSVYQDDLDGVTAEEIREYFELMQRLVWLRAKANCEIHSPFLDISKAEVVELGVRLGVPSQNTFSCSANVGYVHCGRCSQCRRRTYAFSMSKITDPLFGRELDQQVS